MVVGRGNDAIPTWSGFNYQGKMMLLYVLELINQIAKDKNKDIDAYSVELEKTEDFCIICDSEYKSFHQVKAYLSKDKWNSYSKAMDKLLKHRAESNNPTAKCYLTVAKEIKDWDDASNTYNVSVELYKRASKVVGVCDVRNEIDTEILAYLKSKGYSDKAEEIVYGELCLFLDDSIARMHKQDSKKRKYIIKFSDIVGIMESAIDKEDVRKEYFLKEKIYEYVMQNIEKALNNLCQDECDTSLENCNRICAAKCGYEKMTEIVDYGQFCKLLNPGKVDEWDNELNLVENLSVDKIQSEIYELLYRSDVELLYDNDYDEFSPISQELEKKIHKIDGIDWENSNLIEGAYVTTVISRKGIRPYDEGLSNLTNDNMVEGFSWDTVQILNDNQILSLEKYVQDNQLNIDLKSLEEGNGVLIIHDHMLTPEQQKLADEAIGEPVYFKTLLSREDAIRRKEQSNSENKEKQQEDEFPQKESETFTLCGYLDRQNDDFPEINQSWHGECSLYYFISEKGFQKIPTEKKILTMELTANPEKEPYVKTQISELVSEENKKRSEMTEVSMDEGTGEAGVFVICKSDLMQQKETYMRGNRILLGAVSIILFIAGLTNYCNVVFTGMYARRKEFDVMKSIGMTDKQMKLMLFGEGSYYFMCVVGLLFTVGMAALVGVKIYMENKLSYFTFRWPILIIAGIMLSLLVVNVLVTHFVVGFCGEEKDSH